jgi:hypothetical protein
MKTQSLQVLAAVFALALMTGPVADAHGGWGGGGWHGGGGGWHGGYGGFYGGYVGFGGPYWYSDDNYGYPYYLDPQVTNPAPASGSLVVQVQKDLARAGYYQGDIDGVIGPSTRAAIAHYQQDHGMQVTSRIDESLLQALGLI